MKKYYFTSESVTEGHPDKVCDQISDSILDSLLAQDPDSRVACETMANTGMIIIAGEITTKAFCDMQSVVRDRLREIGYVQSSFGIAADDCAVLVSIDEQSPDIAMGVDELSNHEQGAGDQGMMFGFACNETPELMPLPISLANKLTKQLSDKRKDGTLGWARPDGKAQVTVEYLDGKPNKVTKVVIAAHHAVNITRDQLESDIKKYVIQPVVGDYLAEDTQYFINSTGSFTVGGPKADAGLTGRKIIVDTYGGMGRHGGGAFSGKDPSKVDRSAAYAARYIAKNIVAAGLAERCEVELAYSIGVAEPVSLYVNTFGTGTVEESDLENKVREIFPTKPGDIIRELDLKRPIYQKTAAYGHFGRELPEFTWEKTDKVEALRKAFNL
ncbi:MAG: methionine adenosyltransferase [Candidatus Marinimicrobia bacterium]|nr:methionine adenosyltransferase [Candidatus Neomarinimicrobiota bacterium]